MQHRAVAGLGEPSSERNATDCEHALAAQRGDEGDDLVPGRKHLGVIQHQPRRWVRVTLIGRLQEARESSGHATSLVRAR